MSRKLTQLYDVQREEQNSLQNLRNLKKQIENESDFQNMIRTGTVEMANTSCQNHPEYIHACDTIKALEHSTDLRNKQIQTLYRKEQIRNEKARIKRSGLTEQEYRFTNAIKMFGTTDRFEASGFLLPDGTMLNFDPSGCGQRTEDHAIATSCFDDPDINRFAYKAIHEFLRLGAIRTGDAFLEVCLQTEPTPAQYRIIHQMNRHYGPIYLDIIDTDYCISLSVQTMQAVQTIRQQFAHPEYHTA